MEKLKDYVCGVVYNDLGQPLFFLSESEDTEPILVLDYTSVQVLIGYLTDYLIHAEEYFED